MNNITPETIFGKVAEVYSRGRRGQKSSFTVLLQTIKVKYSIQFYRK